MTATGRLLVAPIGDYRRASSRLRAYDWIPRLRHLGLDVALLQPADRACSRGGWEQTTSTLPDVHVFGPAEGPRAVDWCDAVLAQERPLPRRMLRRVRDQGKRVVVDFSDPIHVTAAPLGLARLRHRLTVGRAFEATIASSHCIVVENDRIAEGLRRRGHDVLVMRGPVDPDRFKPPSLKGTGACRTVVGWTGTPSTYQFLKELLPVIDEVGTAAPIELRIVGAPEDPTLSNVPVKRLPWSVDAEPVDVAEFAVGLYYQPCTPWTELRGGGKLPQYMVAGVAIVASRCGVAAQMIDDGRTGLLATSPEEWRKVLIEAVSNVDLRERVATAAREEALARHTYAANLPHLLEALGLA